MLWAMFQDRSGRRGRGVYLLRRQLANPSNQPPKNALVPHLLALVFLLLRLRRRTRFFLHLALLHHHRCISKSVGRWVLKTHIVKIDEFGKWKFVQDG